MQEEVTQRTVALCVEATRLSAGVLFQRKVNAVLLGGGGKGPDVLVGDLDVGNAGVVFHNLSEGLLAVV